MIEQIYALIIAATHSITAIIGIVFVVIKGIKNNKTTSKDILDKFEEMREEVMNTKEYTELKEQLKIAYQENYVLKRKINELLTKIDHIQRKEGDEYWQYAQQVKHDLELAAEAKNSADQENNTI